MRTLLGALSLALAGCGAQPIALSPEQLGKTQPSVAAACVSTLTTTVVTVLMNLTPGAQGTFKLTAQCAVEVASP